MKKIINQQEGYIALVSVLIIGGIIGTIAIAGSFSGINESEIGLQKSLSSKAYYLANTCAERALKTIKDNTSFEGSDTILAAGGECQYNVIKQQGQDRTIEAEGIFQNFNRRVKITINDITPSISVTSWQEVQQF